MGTNMMARNPRITPLHVVGVILLATFGLLLADAGIRIDLPNFTLMGVAMFVLLISGLASLAIDYCAPRLQVCPRISVTDGGVIIQPHRVGPFRLATGALGLCASVMILLSIVPIMRFFPGILVTIAVDGPIAIGLLFFLFFMLRRKYDVGPFFIDAQGFAWSAYGWNFSANWNDVTQICSIGEWRDRLQYVTIVARPGAIIARPRVPRFVHHRRVPWKKWAPGLQALDIQCGPQFLDVPPPYLENLLKFFIEHPEDRVRISRREGLELVQRFFAAGI